MTAWPWYPADLILTAAAALYFCGWGLWTIFRLLRAEFPPPRHAAGPQPARVSAPLKGLPSTAARQGAYATLGTDIYADQDVRLPWTPGAAELDGWQARWQASQRPVDVRQMRAGRHGQPGDPAHVDWDPQSEGPNLCRGCLTGAHCDGGTSFCDCTCGFDEDWAGAGADSHVRTDASVPGWPGTGPAGDFSSHPSPARPTDTDVRAQLAQREADLELARRLDDSPRRVLPGCSRCGSYAHWTSAHDDAAPVLLDARPEPVTHPDAPDAADSTFIRALLSVPLDRVADVFGGAR